MGEREKNEKGRGRGDKTQGLEEGKKREQRGGKRSKVEGNEETGMNKVERSGQNGREGSKGQYRIRMNGEQQKRNLYTLCMNAACTKKTHAREYTACINNPSH